jgi:hypothetical protein
LISTSRKRLGLISAIGLIAIATLTPTPGATRGEMFCLACGERGVADVILNVLLFVPFGLALASLGLTLRRSLLAGFLLSFGLELFQLLLPGRDPTVSDLLCNSVGSVVGYALWSGNPVSFARRLSPAAAFATLLAQLAIIIAGSLLFVPALPTRVYYGQWTPEFADVKHYTGSVTHAQVGNIAVASSRITRSREVRDSLLAGATVWVVGITGKKAPGFAPIFNIFDDHQREVLSLGADRNDFVLRYRTLSAALRLDQPALRFRGMLNELERGRNFDIRVRRISHGFCVSVKSTRACPTGFNIGDAWQVLITAERLPHALASVVRLSWLALLFLPTGFLLVRRKNLILFAATIAAVLLIVPGPAHIAPTPLSYVFSALAGLTIGAALQHQFGSKSGAKTERLVAHNAGNSALRKFDKQRSTRS